MYINLAILVLAFGLVRTATPHIVENRNRTPVYQSLLEQNIVLVSQLPPACNLNACLGLSGTVTCVLSALGTGDPVALQRCFTNGLAEICSCAACVPSAANFLYALGICVTQTKLPHDEPETSINSPPAPLTWSLTPDLNYPAVTIAVSTTSHHLAFETVSKAGH
ncbi:hypothetical protein N7495_004550 [Penicillium taxi]|uniref:uncharacterized protein n=1 Tax=Penicillium taxi TaxID=168475 RepID=UPI0025454C00|nr:uncharacterized protein N7495_004550 [Penicillium taxi]KAJ5899806.1 hypothetical protein N7495_004550 [Penicillium taxi]